MEEKGLLRIPDQPSPALVDLDPAGLTDAEQALVRETNLALTADLLGQYAAVWPKVKA